MEHNFKEVKMIRSEETKDGRLVTKVGRIIPGPFGLNYCVYTIIAHGKDGTRHDVGKDLSEEDANELFNKLIEGEEVDDVHGI
jgi:hypothetical protein